MSKAHLLIRTLLTIALFSSCSKGGGSSSGSGSTSTTVSTPKVTTTAVSNITDNSASSGGSITSNGGGPITSSGIMWDTSNTFPHPHELANTSGNTGFTETMTSLSQGTNWFVRAFAANSADTGFGNTIQFTTDTLPNEYIVTTFAGNGIQALTNGPALQASFLQPEGIALDANGNIYIAEGLLPTSFAPPGDARYIGTNGMVTTLTTLPSAGYDVIVDPAGNAYFTCTNRIIYKLPPGGTSLITLAGSGSQATADGQGTAASFYSAICLAIDSSGNLYTGDNKSIRKITPGGYVSTLPVQTKSPFVGITIDHAQNIYVSDSCRIEKIDPLNNVTFIAGGPGSADGTGSAAGFGIITELRLTPGGNLIAADPGNHKIRSITPEGVVTTIAGTGQSGNSDGSGSRSTFNNPVGLAVDAAGNIYVADAGANNIRKITHK